MSYIFFDDLVIFDLKFAGFGNDRRNLKIKYIRNI